MSSLNVVGALSTLSKGAAVPKSSKIKTGAAKAKPLNPIGFGLKVVQSNGGQEASGELVGGGLKLVGAILEEGKSSKVVIPRGFDYRTGTLQTRVVNVGPKELIDGGIFAATEAVGAGFSVYSRLYLGGVAKPPANLKLSLPKGGDKDVLNPITFILKVVQSKEGQEAAGVLVGGGLKLVGAILEEGKTSKVEVPRGYDYRSKKLTTKVVSVGIKELVDVGLFAGAELLQVAILVYNKLYLGYRVDDFVPAPKINTIEAKRDKKTNKLVSVAKETYFVNVGGNRVMVTRNQSRLPFIG